MYMVARMRAGTLPPLACDGAEQGDVIEDDLEALDSLEDNSELFPPEVLHDSHRLAGVAKFLAAPGTRCVSTTRGT